MTEEIAALWERAIRTLRTAGELAEEDPDTAAACAYHAAFYAVSALFATRGKTFHKHSAIEAAVHRDLVNTGEFPKEFGRDFRLLQKLRDVGIYGSALHVSESQAREALSQARTIVEAVNRINPTDFPLADAAPSP